MRGPIKTFTHLSQAVRRDIYAMQTFGQLSILWHSANWGQTTMKQTRLKLKTTKVAGVVNAMWGRVLDLLTHPPWTVVSKKVPLSVSDRCTGTRLTKPTPTIKLLHFSCTDTHGNTHSSIPPWARHILSHGSLLVDIIEGRILGKPTEGTKCLQIYFMYFIRATTPFSHCLSTASLPVRPHCTSARWNRCNEDLQPPPPLKNRRRPPGRPHTTWMKTIQQYLESLTSLWTKQLTWLRITHSGDWCLYALI